MSLSDKMNATFVEFAKAYNYERDTKQWLALYNLAGRLGDDIGDFLKKLKNISVDCGEGQCDANMQLREAINNMAGDAFRD